MEEDAKEATELKIKDKEFELLRKQLSDTLIIEKAKGAKLKSEIDKLKYDMNQIKRFSIV